VRGSVVREVEIHLTVLPEQRDLIDQAARRLCKSGADFVLEAALEKAESVLADPVLFRLDAARWDAFTAMLEGPVHPNPGLERLRKAKVPWGSDG
jgi:uncharacterized protein (DUF1778 family)